MYAGFLGKVGGVIGVTSAIAVFRMAGKPDAFLSGLLRSFRRGKTPAGAAKSVLTGLGVGLALGVLTSLRGGGYFCYALGAALLVIGLVLTLLTKNRRAVTAAAALLLCLSPLAGLVTTAQAADSFTLTLDAIIDTSTDNREFESVGTDHSSVTLTTGRDARLQCICSGGNGGNDWTYTYTFDFTWQGKDTWNCESTVFISIYENGVQLGDGLTASAAGELSLDGVSPGEKAEVSAAFVSMENRGEAWGGVWFPHTASSRAVFAVSGGAPLPTASGTWVLENTVYHGENGCGRTLNTPVVFDTVGKSTIMGWKFTNANNFDIPANVSVSNYPERIASGEMFSVALGFHAHRASYACTWVGIDNCGMEQQENRLWAKGGGYDGAIESRLAKQLQDLRRQMVAGGELDVARYARVRDAVGKLSRGEMENESLVSAPPDDRRSPGEIKAAMEMTAREIGTGSSWKALALRGVLAVGTGGASEKVFDVTGALYDMHDAVMAGDSDGAAFSKAVGNYMTGELVGAAAGAGMKKAGGAAADTKVGQKAMRAVGDLLDPAAKQADDAAKAAKRLSLAKNAEITTSATARGSASICLIPTAAAAIKTNPTAKNAIFSIIFRN